MTRRWAAVLCAAALAGACQRPAVRDPEAHRKLDMTLERLEQLDERVQVVGRRLDDVERSAEVLLARIDEVQGKLEAAVAARAAAPTAPPSRPGPDPAAVYSVPIAGDPWKGARDAKVTIVMGAEFACPYCDRVRPTLDQILADYPEVKLVFKHFLVHGQKAMVPALAACAAHQQGKFWEMSAAIYERAFAVSDLSEQRMRELAADLGLDLDRFDRDMAGSSCKADIESDQQTLAAVGVRGTPAFYVNGRFLSGARPYEQFKTLIDEELAKADAATRRGVKVRDYYDREIVAKGKKSVE